MTQVNHPSQQDIDSVFDFMKKCDIAEFGEPDTMFEDLEQQWGEINIRQDAWLAFDEQGQVVGYCDFAKENESFKIDIYIHLTLSPDGVEDELMRNCLDRIRKIASAHNPDKIPGLVGYAIHSNVRQCQIYEKYGFERVNHHFRMQIDFVEPVAPPQWPAPFRLDTYHETDEMELYQLIQSAFNWPGHITPSLESWRQHIFRGGRFDPQHFILVRNAERLIGAALSYDEGVQGWIRQLAIHKDYQGKGLGSMLLRQMFSIYSQRNIPRVALGVSSTNEKACQFYERHGMYRSRHFIEYRKKLE